MATDLQQQALRAPPSIGVTSPAFEKGRQMPREYSAWGDDVSPPLRISGVPSGAQGLAIVMDDPDAPGGTFTHWLAWNLPPDLAEIPRGADIVAMGGKLGENDFGRAGYGGPKPPSGTHRYLIRIFALTKQLDAPPHARAAEVWRDLAPNVLAWGETMGTFTKP